MEEKIYRISKSFYENKINLKQGKKLLANIGIIKKDQLENTLLLYSNLITGKKIINNEMIKYFIERISVENDKQELKNALTSFIQLLHHQNNTTKRYNEFAHNIFEKYWEKAFESKRHPNDYDSNIMYNEEVKTNKIYIRKKGIIELLRDYQSAKINLMKELEKTNNSYENIEQGVSILLTENTYGELKRINNSNVFLTNENKKILIETLVGNSQIKINNLDFDTLIIYEFNEKSELLKIKKIEADKIMFTKQAKQSIEKYGVNSTLNILLPYYL